MFAQALRIALAKTNGSEPVTALGQALGDAELLARVESEFEDRINASKASRGEKPTKLSKARRAQVDEYSNDAATLQAEQMTVFDSKLSAIEIVTALKAGLDSDLQFWANAAKYTHPAELPLVQELVDAKVALQASLARCLSGWSNSAV